MLNIGLRCKWSPRLDWAFHLIFAIRLDFMATVHKISTELFEVTYGLIALHSTLDSFAMAFHLNRDLSMGLRRGDVDLELDQTFFPVYEWYDESHDCMYTLFGNKQEVRENKSANGMGLFSEENFTKTAYLLHEKKKVDYFLKLDHEETVNMGKLVKKIQALPKITMAYIVAVDELKSKENIISFYNADQKEN